MFIARKSNHIESDIKRNWSSWNFGLDGFTGTREELDAYLATATEEKTVYISAFELTSNDLKRTKIKELYENYWVVVDDRFDGICGTALKTAGDLDNLQEAIAEAESADFSGDGVEIDTRYVDLVYSEGDIHIFYVEN